MDPTLLPNNTPDCLHNHVHSEQTPLGSVLICDDCGHHWDWDQERADALINFIKNDRES